jgi:hypothetical protein
MLTADPYFIPLTYLLDEAPVGEIMSVVAQTVDSGDVVAQVLPDASWNAVYLFMGISNPDHYLDNNLQKLLSAFSCGAEVRVYRDFFSSVDPYDQVTEPLGYSDVVPVEAGDREFPWYDNVLRRFQFEIEGVEVR